METDSIFSTLKSRSQSFTAARAAAGRLNDALKRVNLRILLRRDADELYRSLFRYRELLRRLHLDEDELFQVEFHDNSVPQSAADYLRSDNPRLIELAARYRSAHHPVAQTPAIWTTDYVSREVDLSRFRGETAYVWQYRDLNLDFHYFLTLEYIERIDSLDLLTKLKEDRYFGVRGMEVRGRFVSRDLLDSINEIYFLERNLRLSERKSTSILDIGAGYGRLAHRMSTAFPTTISYHCTDAIPMSTFLCEFYTQFRGVHDRVSVIPLDELDDRLKLQSIDLAINICSFSECSIEAIDSWLEIASKNDTRYLFIVPDAGGDEGNRLLSAKGPTGGATDFYPMLVRHGYRLICKEPKYADPFTQRHGISPTHYYLFERA